MCYGCILKIGEDMASIKEMAQAHVRNVDQQITVLVNQKTKIEEEINGLMQYFKEGVAELNKDDLDRKNA